MREPGVERRRAEVMSLCWKPFLPASASYHAAPPGASPAHGKTPRGSSPPSGGSRPATRIVVSTRSHLIVGEIQHSNSTTPCTLWQDYSARVQSSISPDIIGSMPSIWSGTRYGSSRSRMGSVAHLVPR